MSEIDDIIRHTIETVQYALREGFKQGWDAAVEESGQNMNEVTVEHLRHRDKIAMEYADGFSQQIGQKLHGWQPGDKVRHQDGQPEGEITAILNGGLLVVTWESGMQENCTPEELTPA